MPEKLTDLKIGDRVRVRGSRAVAKVFSRDKNLERPRIQLDRELDGFRWWNQEDLVEAAPRKKATRG